MPSKREIRVTVLHFLEQKLLVLATVEKKRPHHFGVILPTRDFDFLFLDWFGVLLIMTTTFEDDFLYVDVLFIRAQLGDLFVSDVSVQGAVEEGKHPLHGSVLL